MTVRWVLKHAHCAACRIFAAHEIAALSDVSMCAIYMPQDF